MNEKTIKYFHNRYTRKDIEICHSVQSTYNCGYSPIALIAPDESLLTEDDFSIGHITDINLKEYLGVVAQNYTTQ